MEAEEVDPIAEADVYMAYGRDAQAEEILKEALQKDEKRTAVHVKLLEIYANRKDTKAFEQSALKLKNLTNGAGPEWEKAAALGRSIDPQNGLYGGAGGGGGSRSGGGSTGARLRPGRRGRRPGVGPRHLARRSDAGTFRGRQRRLRPRRRHPGRRGHAADRLHARGHAHHERRVSRIRRRPGLDFDLGTPKTEVPAARRARGAAAFRRRTGLRPQAGRHAAARRPRPTRRRTPDLSSISLDLGATPEPSAPSGGGSDPKWQEVATKLDLAKAYEEMGDKDGARELLNEVMKDGDGAQKGQAQQLLAKLG